MNVQTTPKWIMMSLVLALLAVPALAEKAWIVTPGAAIRLWTPRFASQSAWEKASAKNKKQMMQGFARGPKFQGKLLRLQGLENKRSLQQAVLQLKDGTKRGWPVRSFSDADQAYVKKQVAKVEKIPAYPAKEPKRDVEYQPYTKAECGKVFEIFESPHFTIFRGMNKAGKGKKAFEPGFMKRVLAYMEDNWDFYRDALDTPMPFTTAATQPHDLQAKGKSGLYKINIFLTDTGLPKHKTGWAFGSRSVMIHPNALGEGSSVIAHELGHVMQLYMGGFHGDSMVGSFWETHANWQAHQFIPSYHAGVMRYLKNMHQDLNWSGHRYASWMWLQHLAENPKFTHQLMIDLWTKNRKENNSSLEDPIQTLLRLNQEQKKFGKDPMQDFGDEIGALAAKLVTMDYIFQQTYLDSRRGKSKDVLAVPLTPIETAPRKAKSYRPQRDSVPGQYGINLLEILPEGKDKDVTVTLKEGFHRRCDEGSWRMTLVAVDKDHNARYGKTTREKTVSFKPKAGERLFLAVAAVPAKHKTRQFPNNEGTTQTFPYQVLAKGGQFKPVAAPEKKKK